ncbi:cytochrome P450 [Roridomyces roridus]|uniref:Cytochrome P450 n=1 Tax=Roridomyces roridus TaxID=1738132 RepID=A0AAD7BVB0_9AGAR|nr:cytochrome P450 [Roridomyces roridus]
MLSAYLRHHYPRPKLAQDTATRSTSSTIQAAPFKTFVYIGTLSFFLHPPAFLSACKEWAAGGMFSFWILSDLVIVVRGLTGRDIFYSKGMDFLSGYKLLNPQLKDFLPHTQLKEDQTWGPVLASFSRTGLLEKHYATVLNAIVACHESWGGQGSVDLFKSMNQMVFAISLPLCGCQHLASNPKTVATLINIFDRLDDGATPSALLFPWVPTPARVRRFLAGIQLYRMTKSLVEFERQRSDIDEEDPLQDLIKQNYPVSEVARIIASILFASVVNTANVFAWALVYLEHHAEWKARVLAEVATFLRENDLENSTSLVNAMAGVPLDVLDEKLPSIELVVNEVLRFQLGPFIRRNIGGDIVQDGVHIKNGAFIMFHAADLHHNPDIFPNPDRFDPERFLPEEVEGRKIHGTSFVGFGAGRHACVGKRLALLEIKMMLVLLVAKYDFTIADETGASLRRIPSPNVVQLFKLPEPERPVHIQYRARKGHSTY